MNEHRIPFLPLVLLAALAACTPPAPETPPPPPAAVEASMDSTAADSVAPAPPTPRPAPPELNAAADLISGRASGDAEYRRTAEGLEKDWELLQRDKLRPIRAWMAERYDTLAGQQRLVFYPFGGPDIAFASAFYPDADTYVLVGLEDVGQLGWFGTLSGEETLQRLREWSNILRVSNRFGFFKTIDMRQQFTEERGIADMLMYYLRQMGADLLEAHLLAWEEGQRIQGAKLVDTLAGDEARVEMYEASQHRLVRMEPGSPKRADGIKYVYRLPDGSEKQVYYFRQDLSNDGFSGSPFLAWMTAQGPFCSLNKAASYLMHSNSFSRVRSFMLDNTRFHLQDDTGPRYKELRARGFSVDVHGRYSRIDPLFSMGPQPDLMDAYAERPGPVIPFKIGYMGHAVGTNLQVAY